MTRCLLASLFVSLALFGCGDDDGDSDETVTAPGVGSTPDPEPDPGADPEGCDGPLEERTTEDGVVFVRTPDPCFENLPDWPFEARYVEIDGMRQAYVDEGSPDADPILLLHGQPAWSYLYRFMIPVLVDEGHRVLAMDHLGMGRSDKPIDLEYYSVDNHTERLETFIDTLELSKERTTLFAQDWGSVIALNLIAQQPDRFARIVIGNGGYPVVEEETELPEDIEASIVGFLETLTVLPDQQPPLFDEDGNPLIEVGEGDADIDGFGQWMAFARFYEDFAPSIMLEGLTYFPLEPEEEAAYDAPYPTRRSMSAPRIFPTLRNDLVGVSVARKEALRAVSVPFTTIFGRNDPGLSGEGDDQEWMMTNIAGAAGQTDYELPEASHFLQDDAGEEIAGYLNDFIVANPLP
ncbi:MAG: alpha/beta fold hydrolase [Myxococcota bacterium]